MPMELGTVTALSFYKSNGPESAPILLILVKWEFCCRDEEGLRILIKRCIIILLLKYSVSAEDIVTSITRYKKSWYLPLMR